MRRLHLPHIELNAAFFRVAAIAAAITLSIPAVGIAGYAGIKHSGGASKKPVSDLNRTLVDASKDPSLRESPDSLATDPSPHRSGGNASHGTGDGPGAAGGADSLAGGSTNDGYDPNVYLGGSDALSDNSLGSFNNLAEPTAPGSDASSGSAAGPASPAAPAAEGCQAQQQISANDCNALMAVDASIHFSEHARIKAAGFSFSNPCTPASFWDATAKNPVGIRCEGTRIWGLYFDDLSLEGSLPNEIGSLTELRDIRARRNGLKGTIPASIGNLTKLQYLFLGANALTGEIPPTVASLTNLVVLGLTYNQLYGTVPPRITTTLTKLRVKTSTTGGGLALSNNPGLNFTGWTAAQITWKDARYS